MRILTSLVVAALAWCAPAAIAQTYPSKPIRLIVPWPPGGNVDITGRILGASLTEQFGQTVIIDNRGGAGGTLGSNIVAKSTPDGYTLLMASSGSVTSGPAVYANMPYDPVRDLVAISMVHIVPNVVLASLKTPVANLRELIALAKERPGKVTMASGGIGTTSHLVIELLNAMAGVKFLHVPYKGSGPALSELMGGQVDTMVDQLPASIGFIREGRLKALAVTTLKRSSVMPDIPTMDESGLKGFDANTFTGVFAPAGTPPAVINALHAAILRAVRSAAVKEKFRGLGADPQETTPQQFSAFIRSDIEKWKKVAQEAGVKVE